MSPRWPPAFTPATSLVLSALLGLSPAGCGSPQVAPDGPAALSTSSAGAPATSSSGTPTSSSSGTPAANLPLSRANSCEEADHVFKLESRSGTGSVSPMYGFANLAGTQPTHEEALAHLESVLAEYHKTSARLDPAVRAKSDAIAASLSAQRALRKKRIEETRKADEEARKADEEAKKKGLDQKTINRQAALRDAAAFGMMGLVGMEDEMGPLRDAYFDAYLTFFDECATDLGISAKAQAAHHAIFPRKGERGDEK